MTTEDQLKAWTRPSSDTEQDKQERTERMVRQAVADHAAFKGCDLSVYAKGSYPNQTNVRSDSDVDIAVQCHEAYYWDGSRPESTGSNYEGVWTPDRLRRELVAAMTAAFPDQVDTSGSTAITVRSSTARVDADVVPCFNYRYYFDSGGYREGAKTFKKAGGAVVNYPAQHLAEGQRKQAASSNCFKPAVRILKRVENLMCEAGIHEAVPSYFVECLVYNCPNAILTRPTWVETIKGVLGHIWTELEGAEPSVASERWVEVNGCKYLFAAGQKWSRADGRSFAKAAWNYLEFG